MIRLHSTTTTDPAPAPVPPRRTARALGAGLVALLLGVLSVLALPATASASTDVSGGSVGTVVAWGYDGYRETQVPAPLAHVTKIAAGGHHNLALRSDGTVVAWGADYAGQADVPAGLSGVTAIAAGADHSLALRSDGTVVAWGRNRSGQADVPAGLRGVTAITAGMVQSLALKQDGTVVAWGNDDDGATAVPGGLTGVTAIAAGYAHVLALKQDGTIVAWGHGNAGDTVVPDGLSDVVAIAAGGFHSMALKSDGTVVAWGDEGWGTSSVPPGLTGVTAIAAGGFFDLALKQDGTVVAWGDDWWGPVDVPLGLNDVTAISAGDYHALALQQSPVAGDTTAPQLTVPSDETVEATGPDGASVSFGAATATDDTDPAPAVTCDRTSGTTFPLGTTTVSCRATDAAGNTSTGSFAVEVRDTTPPTLTLPRPITVDAVSPAGAPVDFTPTAADLVDGATAVGCSPAAGSTFAIGDTTVTCTSADSRHHEATGSFTVTVLDAAQQAANLADLIDRVAVPGGSAKVAAIRASIRAGNVHAARGQLHALLNATAAARRTDRISDDEAAAVTSAVGDLLGTLG